MIHDEVTTSWAQRTSAVATALMATTPVPLLVYLDQVGSKVEQDPWHSLLHPIPHRSVLVAAIAGMSASVHCDIVFNFNAALSAPRFVPALPPRLEVIATSRFLYKLIPLKWRVS